jgi:hypothetical protein
VVADFGYHVGAQPNKIKKENIRKKEFCVLNMVFIKVSKLEVPELIIKWKNPPF